MKAKGIISLVAAVLFFFAAFVVSNAQDGTYKVTETWNVTVYNPYDQQILRRSGTESGTITVANGGYELINTVGTDVGSLDGSLQYSEYYGQYALSGQRVLYAFGGQGSQLLAIVKLGFFVVAVPLGSSFGFSLFQSDDTYSALGSGLSDLQGFGTAMDGNGETWNVSSTAQLTLPNASAPKISLQPKSQLAEAGTNVIFTVSATGVPSVSYQWQHNGADLYDGGEFSGTKTPVLTIDGVESGDVGTYSVVVANAEGSVTSAGATLTIGSLLPVQINGEGTVSPNESGQLLTDGQSYTLTASPARGFGFKDWTDGNGEWLTNGTTLKFTMAPSLALTANFADTTTPVVAITNIPTGLVVGSPAFTLKGTSGDNVAVSTVWYQLNTNGWQSATPGNTWSNWTAAVTLKVGTNLVAAYAVDTSGNASPTVTNRLDYVVSAVLTVQTNQPHWGAITPNLNTNLLAIGRNYSLTAAAAAGFQFLNWSNNLAGVMTNRAVLTFGMQSNLVLTANFADVTAPKLTITAPGAGQRVSSAVFKATGTGSDNAAVAAVALQLNHGGWTSATGTTNWSASVTLTPGTNLVQAYALDTSGNQSATNSVSCDFVVTNQLGVRVTGLGSLTPNDSNAWLEVGRDYTLTAKPALGFVFTNWTVSTNWLGGVPTNQPTVQFMMASNLTLTASFVETSKPVVTITNLTAGRKVPLGPLVVRGTTSDNWQVTNVWCEIGAGGWLAAGTTNNYKNWAVTNLNLVAGTNVVRVYGVNLGGLDSVTNTISVAATNVVDLPVARARAVGAENPAVVVTGTRMTAGGLTFNLQISGAVSGLIQVSTNLVNWGTVTNFAGTNTAINFIDSGATNARRRFYRAVLQ